MTTRPSRGTISDSPEVLTRFHSELDLVDLNARQLWRRLGTSTVTLDDLRSFGREGLLQAARAFDHARGVPFRRWANLRIRGAMIDGVRQWGALPRRVYRDLRTIESADKLQENLDEEDSAHPTTTPEAAETRLTTYLAGMATAIAMGTIAPPTDAPDAGPSEASPEELVANAELVSRIRDIIQGLPDSERILLERHYFGEQTLDQAAASLGLSKSWGSRLHARAIEAVARELRRREGL